MSNGARPASSAEVGFARAGAWAAIVTALVPVLVAAVPALAVIPEPALVGLLLGGVTALGKLARSATGGLWKAIGQWF